MALNVRGVLVAVVLCASVWSFPTTKQASASCSAPTRCTVSTAIVTSCAMLDPSKEPALSRYADALRKQHDDRLPSLLAAYRGVIVEASVTKNDVLACNGSLPRARYDEVGYAISIEAPVVGKPGHTRYFVPTTDADRCRTSFPARRELRVLTSSACCDGDPGPPCLLR